MSRQSQPTTIIAAALALVLIIASSLASDPLAQDTPSDAGGSVVNGVFTADQATRGGKQFQLTCTACHSVVDHASTFETKWQGTTLGDLFEFISTTMPEGNPGSLKPDEYASIVAFFLSETGYKEGGNELTSDLESLKKIRIEPVPK